MSIIHLIQEDIINSQKPHFNLIFNGKRNISYILRSGKVCRENFCIVHRHVARATNNTDETTKSLRGLAHHNNYCIAYMVEDDTFVIGDSPANMMKNIRNYHYTSPHRRSFNQVCILRFKEELYQLVGMEKYLGILNKYFRQRQQKNFIKYIFHKYQIYYFTIKQTFDCFTINEIESMVVHNIEIV